MSCRSNHSRTIEKEFGAAWIEYGQIYYRYLLLGADKNYWRVKLKNTEWNGNDTETCTYSLNVSYFLTPPPLAQATFPLSGGLNCTCMYSIHWLSRVTIEKSIYSAKGALTILISLTMVI